MADGRASSVGANQDAAGGGGSIGEVCRHGLVVLGEGDVGQTLLVADVEVFGEEGALDAEEGAFLDVEEARGVEGVYSISVLRLNVAVRA